VSFPWHVPSIDTAMSRERKVCGLDVVNSSSFCPLFLFLTPKTVSMDMRILLKPPASGSNVMYRFTPSLRKGDLCLLSSGMSC
jgi:hypothetical protein